MFVNNLTGLTKREKEVFDFVCIHLNRCLRRMDIRELYGEEDQILIDLWMDSFPHKLDSNGNYVMRTVREKSWETVDGKYVEVIKEKQVKELDFTKSLMEEKKPDGTYLYQVGIYKWRGEQLLINKCKYLFGDNRVRKLTKDGKVETREEKDAWGNTRVRAVYEEKVNEKKVSKRDLSKCVLESELHKDGEEPMTLDTVCGGDDGGLEDIYLKIALESSLNEVELAMVNRLLEGDSMSRVRNEIGVTSKQERLFKEKMRRILKPNNEELEMTI